jgi:hypothetical protein
MDQDIPLGPRWLTVALWSVGLSAIVLTTDAISAEYERLISRGGLHRESAGAWQASQAVFDGTCDNLIMLAQD